jgi:DNA-binding MarR family transcriptional regulator
MPRLSDKEAVERLDAATLGLYEKLTSWEESVAEQVGLTPRQCHAVAELGKLGRVRMKPLSEHLGITTGTLTVMADRLQNLDIISRVEDPTDKRASYIVLTAKGEEIFRQHTRHHLRLAEELLSAVSDEEASLFIPILEKIQEVL